MNVSLNATDDLFSNATDDSDVLYPPNLRVPITVVYAVIFVTGLLGNVSTCVVIAKNKSMHTATNYYLFSMAVSDLLLLISGLPPEMYSIWNPNVYVFGKVFCVMRGFAAETSANATVLTITAFTVERYFAICRPFLAHTMSKLSRAIRYIIIIWLGALCLAVPQAIQFGIKGSECTRVSKIFEHAFEVSTFLFFVAPMTLITVLYILIWSQLKKSRRMSQRGSLRNAEKHTKSAAQSRVVKMLIAVVVAFFICWAPFHAQRLLAVYLSKASKEVQAISTPYYLVLMYASGILYYVSTTVNPVLYHIMSHKFREAFRKTITDLWCGKQPHLERQNTQTYSVLNRIPPPVRRISENIENSSIKNSTINDKHCKQQDNHTSSLKIVTDDETKKAGQETLKTRVMNFFNKKSSTPFGRQSSVDSTNTISDSSLQDVDEMDYSNSNLVRYMEKINEDIA